MADQSVRVTNLPDSGSPQRVAYDLMRTIVFNEQDPPKDQVRQYYLDLYKACRQVVF